jgi:hypothetical protein
VRLAVTGSRHWTDEGAIFRALDDVRPRPTLLIHGGARGADRIAEMWAKSRKIATACIRPADATVKADYIKRNRIIVDVAEYVIAFLAEGPSHGTKYTIQYAEEQGKLIAVIEPHGTTTISITSIPTDANTDQPTQKERE